MENKKMKIARIENNLTQEELAFLTNISRKTIGMIESGKMFNPSLQVCSAICRVLNKDLNELFWVDYSELPRGTFVLELEKGCTGKEYTQRMQSYIEEKNLQRYILSIEEIDLQKAEYQEYTEGNYIIIKMFIIWESWKIIQSVKGCRTIKHIGDIVANNHQVSKIAQQVVDLLHQTITQNESTYPLSNELKAKFDESVDLLINQGVK